jgi:hypothetical protein
MIAAAGAVYLAGSLIHWRPVPPQPLIVQSIATIVLYPLIAVIMGLIYRHIVGASRTDD